MLLFGYLFFVVVVDLINIYFIYLLAVFEYSYLKYSNPKNLLSCLS